ncbi:MAG: sigma-70 family RNA polymerase sigma factor [Acidobacteriota bacterium]
MLRLGLLRAGGGRCRLIAGPLPKDENTVNPNPQTPPDEASWQPFVAGLRRFVAGRVPALDAEDVAQEVLLRLHQRAHTLRDTARAEAWVYGVARRVIADHYRARKVPLSEGEDLERLELPLPADAPSLASFEGDHSVHEEVLTWLRPLAEELPEKYRRALVLADFEGRTQREVAAELGLSLSGAKSRVQRARSMLGDALARCCQVEMGPDGRAVDFLRRECAC